MFNGAVAGSRRAAGFFATDSNATSAESEGGSFGFLSDVCCCVEATSVIARFSFSTRAGILNGMVATVLWDTGGTERS